MAWLYLLANTFMLHLPAWWLTFVPRVFDVGSRSRSEIVYIRIAGAVVLLWAMSFVLHQFPHRTSVQRFLYGHMNFLYSTGLDFSLSLLVMRLEQLT